MIIDTFFDTLDWGNLDSPTVNLVTFGDFMNMVNMKNRWVYQGSLTTPPCEQKVYWNVLQTIYPIKKAHLDLFKKQIARGEDGKLGEYGNWRAPQTFDAAEHKAAVVTEKALGSDKKTRNNIIMNVNLNIYN